MSNPGETWVKDIYQSGYTVTSHWDYPSGSWVDTISPTRVLPSGFDMYFRSPNTNNRKSASSGWRQPAAFEHNRIYGVTRSTGDILRLQFGSLPLDGYAMCYGIDASNAPNSYYLPDFPSRLVDVALTKALLKLQNQQVNLATNFVERKQTAELVNEGCRFIAASVRSFRQRNPAALWDFIRKTEGSGNRNIPDEWLKLQYGWKPTMGDIYAAADAVERRSTDGIADRCTVTGTAHDEVDTVVQTNAAGVNNQISISRRNYFKASVSLSYTMDNPAMIRLSQLGITNPAYLVWEEIPFSFVVDWFLPVGNMLNSWTADFGWKFLGGSYSRKTRSTSRSVGLTHGPGFFDGVSGSFNYYQTAEVFNRNVYATSPVPGVHLKNPISSLHVSEALSLLAQAFR
jgi:hypothetical protein